MHTHHPEVELPPERALELAGVAGRIVTPAHDVVRKIDLLLSGEAESFGLRHLLPGSPSEVLDALYELAGWRPDQWRTGTSWVEPGRVVAQARVAAERLQLACNRGEYVLFGTGHPTGPLELYVRLADAMRAAGAEIVQFAEGEPFATRERRRRQQLSVRYIGSVACVTDGGNLLHTHEAAAMEYLLDTGPRPDLVVGDHGFAGAALARGADAVALVDTNDPALMLAWARGMPVRPIVCDDNRPPESYSTLYRLLAPRG